MARPFRRAVCWVRRDLRLHDHAALAYATAQAEEVAVLFVFDTQILDPLQDRDDRRVTLIHQCLTEMAEGLRERGSQLVVRHGDPLAAVPDMVQKIEADLLVYARDYEPYAWERDAQISASVVAASVKDSLVLEPDAVRSQAGQPLRVFTPFSKAWKKALQPERDLACFEPDWTRLISADRLAGLSCEWGLEDLGFRGNDLAIAAGEKAGRECLGAFVERLASYAQARNFPAVSGTSGLSQHLRFGTVSCRDLVRLALTAPDETWLNELIWREFYAHLLFHYPRLVSQTFQPQYSGLAYPNPPGHFEAWAEGRTGYPIVDAAMRQLKATGQMHNRLRMITASFLTKDLLVDYRLGEAHFARYLLDFDLASNNGGWQWAASVGADAQPYFRVFNPILQSAKFDPDGTYIRTWIPELAELQGEAIHAPWTNPMALEMAGIRLGENYPEPIVDHAAQREVAIQLYRT